MYVRIILAVLLAEAIRAVGHALCDESAAPAVLCAEQLSVGCIFATFSAVKQLTWSASSRLTNCLMSLNLQRIRRVSQGFHVLSCPCLHPG